MNVSIIIGDCREILPTLADQSVQCCVTSPPYWGLRDYGHGEQIGLESTPDAFAAEMVEVFRQVRRVLKDDGTLWLNLGDSYSSGGRKTQTVDNKRIGATSRNIGTDAASGKQEYLNGTAMRPPVVDGLGPKQLMGIPWRVAFALQADGWYLRSDIIWHKPNPMPESVTDRPTKSHEYIFLLSKSERYFYDYEAVREPFAEASIDRYNYNFGGAKSEALVEANKDGLGVRTRVVGKRELPSSYNGSSFNKGQTHDAMAHLAAVGQGERNELPGRNKRTVWTVATQPYSEAHFATYPPDLIKPCILAGSRPGDTVLDPFGGSGTTGMVALELGRSAILCELNPEYAELARTRCSVTPGFPNLV